MAQQFIKSEDKAMWIPFDEIGVHCVNITIAIDLGDVAQCGHLGS